MSTTTPNPAFATAMSPVHTGHAASKLAAGAAVDIALLLEGRHPFANAGASGGVPGWAERMIRAFPQTTFAIVDRKSVV